MSGDFITGFGFGLFISFGLSVLSTVVIMSTTGPEVAEDSIAVPDKLEGWQ